MTIRTLLLTTICASLFACGGPKTPDPVPPAPPAASEPTPTEPVAVAAPAPPAAPAALAPPQKWQQLGKNGDRDVVMGFVEWRGGEDYQVELMGTMKYIVQQKLAEVVKENPADAGGAIHAALMEMYKDLDPPTIRWVRLEAK